MIRLVDAPHRGRSALGHGRTDRRRVVLKQLYVSDGAIRAPWPDVKVKMIN